MSRNPTCFATSLGSFTCISDIICCGLANTTSSINCCHVCGEQIEKPFEYKPIPKAAKGKFPRGYLRGKNYYEFEAGKDKRALYCPICKNHEFGKKASYCRICGTPLYNHCSVENKVVSVECRYCPDCGGSTTYHDLYEAKKDEIPIPSEFNDYIKYEHWEFIRYIIGYQNKKDMGLYATLSDSVVYRDGGDFVLFVQHKLLLEEIERNIEEIKSCIEAFGMV